MEKDKDLDQDRKIIKKKHKKSKKKGLDKNNKSLMSDIFLDIFYK